MSEYVYKVFDTETGVYWKSPRGKSIWSAQNHAKNAWNASGRRYWKEPKFNEQDRFEIHQFLMTLERVAPR